MGLLLLPAYQDLTNVKNNLLGMLSQYEIKLTR